MVMLRPSHKSSPSCAVIRAKAREMNDCEESLVNLSDTFNMEDSYPIPSESLAADSGMSKREKLIKEQ